MIVHRGAMRPCFCTRCLCLSRAVSTAARVCDSCERGDHYPDPRPKVVACQHGQAFVDGYGRNAKVRCRFCLLVMPD